NARMVLNEFVYDPNGKSNSTLFSLSKGTFTFIAGKVAKTGDMKIDTPVATMGIRGTTPHVEISYAVFCLKKKKTDAQSVRRSPSTPAVTETEPRAHRYAESTADSTQDAIRSPPTACDRKRIRDVPST